MNRLTEKDLQGNWCLKDVPWERLHVGQQITEELWQKLYGALWKLMEYEDTGLSPEEVEEVNKFEGSNGQKWLLEIAKHRWIPVSERLPEEHESIFAKFKGTDKWSNAMFEKASDDVNITYEFEDGTRKTATSYTIDGEWKLERRITKRKVIAWQPLPTPYKGELNPKDISHTCDTCRRYGKSDHNCYYCKFKPRQDLWEPKEADNGRHL